MYVLRDTSLIKQYRDMLGLAKTDENDALTLSIIQRDAFREITTEEVKLRKLLLQFELLSRLKRKMRGWNTQFSLLLEEERVDHKCRRLSKIIEEEARRTMPFYRLVEERLGLRGL